MNDRELLEAAAKAAGIDLHVWGLKGQENFADMGSLKSDRRWNPLTDDGDALRLAVKLGLFTGPEFFHFRSLERFAYQDKDEYFVTRRAIVRAAAAMAG